MKTSKKAVIWLLCIVFILFSCLAGCGGNVTSKPDNQDTLKQDSQQPGNKETVDDKPKSKFEGQMIRFIACNHMWTEAIKPLIPEFEKETGIKVSLESYSEDQLTQKLTIELTSGNSTMDVFMTRPLQEARLFSKNKWYQVLDDYIKKAPADWGFNDFMLSTVNCTRVNGESVAIPIINEYEILFYRKDLFEQANLKPPATFDELEAACAKLNNPSEGIAGIVSRGQLNPCVTQFSSYLFNFGGDFLKDGKCVIDSPEAVKAIQFYGRILHDYGPPGVTNMSWPQCVAVFASGKAAMYTDASVMLSQFTDTSKSQVADKFGVALFPAGPAGNHPFMVTSWGLAIPQVSKSKDAAWEFIQWSTNKQNMKNAQLKNVTQTRTSVWNDPEISSKLMSGFNDITTKMGEIATPHDRPLMTSVVQARDIIGGLLVTSIESGGKADIAALAKDAAAKINDLLAKDGEGGK